MDEVDRIVELAREAVRHLLAVARQRLLEGSDVAWIHRTYVARGWAMLEEVELYAVLASAGDQDALVTIETITAELDALVAALERDPG